ncbi:MAG: hypothetical protein ABI430_04585 [Candidatus Taylorbacteria bacterium]
MKFSFKKKKAASNKKKIPIFFSFWKNPYHDWKILLIVSAVLFLAVLSLSIYLFAGVLKGDLSSVPLQEEATPKTFKQEVLKGIISDFDARAIKLNELRAQRIDIADPSL